MKIKWRERGRIPGLVPVTMLNIGRGWLVPVTMQNIGRGRRRDHPQPSVKKSAENPHFRAKGPTRADFAQLLVAHAHTLPSLQATFGSHGTCTTTLVRKKRGGKPGHAQNILPDWAASGHVTFG